MNNALWVGDLLPDETVTLFVLQPPVREQWALTLLAGQVTDPQGGSLEGALAVDFYIVQGEQRVNMSGHSAPGGQLRRELLRVVGPDERWEAQITSRLTDRVLHGEFVVSWLRHPLP